MDSDLLTLIVGLGALLVLGVLWSFHYVSRQIKILRQVEQELTTLFEDRRDILPYLLESYRTIVPSISGRFQEIIDQRATARNSQEFRSLWLAEEKLERIVGQFLNENNVDSSLGKDIGWLEAKRDVEKLDEAIEGKKANRQVLHDYLEGKRRQIPYFLFSSYIEKSLEKSFGPKT